MGVLSKIRDYLGNLKNKIAEIFRDLKGKFANLQEVNRGLAVDYLETGMIGECRNRLRIILKLWSDDDYARYLMALVQIMYRENAKALEYLKSMRVFERDGLEELVKKLITLVETNKTERLIELYRRDSNLSSVENEIFKI